MPKVSPRKKVFSAFNPISILSAWQLMPRKKTETGNPLGHTDFSIQWTHIY